MLKFLLDEHISGDIADSLRSREGKWVILSLAEWEQGRFLAETDLSILEEATKQGLTLVTYDLRTIPHVGEAIATIDLAKCVASSGTPEKIRHGLTCAGLYDLLAPHIFSAVQVTRGKPAPDLFLFAAAQMQASPERCLVIEDSIPGITGARAAGMTVLGFHGGSHCRPGYADTLSAAGATTTFDDMRQLPGLIVQIGQQPGLAAGFPAL